MSPRVTRRYFSQREGAAPVNTTQDFAYRFYNIFEGFVWSDYFERLDIGASYDQLISYKLRRELAIAFGLEGKSMLPTESNLLNMSRDSIFDLIEFLSEYVSEPPVSRLQPDSNRGLRADNGPEKWRKAVNECFERLDLPYHLTANKEIEVASPSAGLQRLVDDHAGPSRDAQEKVDHACRMFLRRNATIHDRLSALKDLADVLELLRDDLEADIGKKEADRLFYIANNYGIRHHNRKQMELDENYMRWFFYSALATIDLMASLDKPSKDPQRWQDAAKRAAETGLSG